MARSFVLSKGEVLWREGEGAESVLALEEGRLGVQIGGHLVSVIHRGAALGESALLSHEAREPRRMATVVALEEGASVTEYPTAAIREMFDAGDGRVASLILKTLAAQVCKDALLVIVANPDQPLVEAVLKEIARSVAIVEPGRQPTWPVYLADFRFLYRLRNFTESLRDEDIPCQEPEVVEKASHLVSELFQGSDMVPLLETFLRSEREALLGSRKAPA